jgi:hypothetical protein
VLPYFVFHESNLSSDLVIRFKELLAYFSYSTIYLLSVDDLDLIDSVLYRIQ